ncbi:MAG: hypothetical protein IKE77_03875 [Erysipelotrichaceae bacterium]|nr:hypothetical protein [Erysipelotrichaceae bacterium]
MAFFNSAISFTTTCWTLGCSLQTIVLAPGFLNDHNPQFAWIPYDTDITFQCALCTHNSDNRKPVRELVARMIDYYRNNDLKL